MDKERYILAQRKIDAWCLMLEARYQAHGRMWYQNAHTFAKELAKMYDISLEKVCGIIAVLSPQNRWGTNKRDAEAMCKAYAAKIDLKRIVVATYPQQKAKAIAILNDAADYDDIADMVAGPRGLKTRAFFDNIHRPNTSQAVTIDRWMLRGFGLGQFVIYPALYRFVEKALQDKARTLGYRPHELQAAMWVCIQETANRENWDDSRPTYKADELPF